MVIFSDLSEVHVKGMLKLYERVQAKYGPIGGEWFSRRKQRMEPILQDAMRGTMTMRSYWEIFCEDTENSAKIKAEELEELFLEEIRGKLADPATEVLRSIKAYPHSFRNADQEIIRGCPQIVMVSDHFRECKSILKESHPEVFSLFSREIWSFRCHKIKSDPSFFGRLLFDMNLRARDVLFIDDLPMNCLSACRAGIKTVRYTNSFDLKSWLKSNHFVLG